ncbi:MAG: hypothetical protein D6736_20800, partial [Nitrospinota bacterium]
MEASFPTAGQQGIIGITGGNSVLGEGRTMSGLLHTALCQGIIRLLIVALVFQTWPIWEVSRSYRRTAPPERPQQVFASLIRLLSPPTAEAAAPVAQAGSDRSVPKNHPLQSDVILDGTGSFDPDGDPLTYHWYGPFTTTGGVSPVVQIPEGRYTVSLIVNDGTTDSSLATVELESLPCFPLTARAKPGKVQLVWTHQAGSTRYDVYRADTTAPATFTKIGETTSTYATYLDTTVVNETTYLYLVDAVSQDTSCYSAVISSHPTARRRSRANYAPVLYSLPVTHGTVGIPYTYDVNATDPNGNGLSYQVTQGPAGLTIEASTGRITWVPPAAGAFAVTVEVSDGRGGSDTQSFTLTVADMAPPNSAPSITSTPVTTATEGQPYSYDVEASDPDPGDT